MGHTPNGAACWACHRGVPSSPNVLRWSSAPDEPLLINSFPEPSGCVNRGRRTARQEPQPPSTCTRVVEGLLRCGGLRTQDQKCRGRPLANLDDRHLWRSERMEKLNVGAVITPEP